MRDYISPKQAAEELGIEVEEYIQKVEKHARELEPNIKPLRMFLGRHVASWAMRRGLKLERKLLYQRMYFSFCALHLKEPKHFKEYYWPSWCAKDYADRFHFQRLIGAYLFSMQDRGLVDVNETPVKPWYTEVAPSRAELILEKFDLLSYLAELQGYNADLL